MASKGERVVDRGASFSNKRKNNTKTEGTRFVCFRIHIGAMRPSGWRGEDGCNGDRGDRGGYEAFGSAGFLGIGTFRGGNWTI